MQNQDEQVATSPKLNEAVFPYIYGSLSFSMGKKSESFTHKWICYVRGVNNEDISYLIKKVVFTLHASFTNPVRQIYKPPYQIQQVGWGQFEILVKIHFNHPDMPSIEIPHMLKLHHSQTGSQQSKKPLCSEIYDEVVFTQIDSHIEKIIEARNQMKNTEMIPEHLSQQSLSNEQLEAASLLDQPLKSIVCYSNYFTVIEPIDHRNRLQDAFRFIKGQISSLQQKMRIADLDIQKVYEDIYAKTN